MFVDAVSHLAANYELELSLRKVVGVGSTHQHEKFPEERLSLMKLPG